MANLTQNLELLRAGKQKVIDAVTGKLKEDPGLNIDSTWTAIEAAINSIVVKADPTINPDASQDLTRLCNKTIDYAVKVESLQIPDSIFRNQKDMPMFKAPFAETIETKAFYGCTTLYDIQIPKVKSIGASAFYLNKGLGEVNLPECTTISDYAFYQNTNLETLHTPKLQTIGSYAFKDNTKLKNIDLENVATIGNNAFDNTGLIDVELPNLTAIGSEVFYNCSSLETIAFDALTTCNSSPIVANCSKLTDISMANLVTRYSSSGFLIDSCSSLVNLFVPKVTTIVGPFIGNCPSISELELPRLTSTMATLSYSNSYNHRLASNLSSVTRISLPVLKEYGASPNANGYLISDCPKLTNLELPSLQRCGASSTNYGYVYYGDLLARLGIKTLDLPSLNYITTYYGHTIAYNCKNLEQVNLPSLQSMYSECGDWRSTIICGAPKLSSIKLPSLHTWRGCRMFESYSESRWCYSPEYCDAVVESAKQYYGSTSSIYYSVYRDYYQYKNGYVSTWKNNIEPAVEPNIWGRAEYASYCGLKTIELPKLSKFCASQGTSRKMCDCLSQLETLSLGDGTFVPATTYLPYQMCRGCHKLNTVILNYPIVMAAPWALTNIFIDCPHLTGNTFTISYSRYAPQVAYANAAGLKDLYFYVPDNLVADYKAATNWSVYADQIKPLSARAALIIDSSITEINDNEYENRTDLTSVSGTGATKVGKYAFANTSADTILLPNATNIGDYAFKDSTNLTALSLYNGGITEIGEGAFMNTGLASYQLNQLTIVPKYLFKNTTSLKAVSINSATIINEEAFINTGLTTITANTVYKVNKAAFKDCADLASITFNNATVIGQEAFMNSGLTSISLPLVTVVKTNAFRNCKLTSIVLPKIALIEEGAFADNTSLASINLYKVFRVGDGAFDGCAALKNLYFSGDVVPECINISKDITWHVRASMLEEFKEQYPDYTIVGDAA